MFRLATLSLANRALVALVTVFVGVFGVIMMGSLKQELIPSLEFPQITVVSLMDGASPEVLDKQVSEPLESALNGVEGLKSSTATSRTGVSTISLTFAFGTNLDRARNQVDRAISVARPALPDGVAPNAQAGSISDIPIVFMAVSSDKPLSALNTDLQRVATARLEKLDGVRSAEVTGGAGQHISILPDPAKMAAAGVDTGSLVDALKNNGALVPAGTLSRDGQTLTIQVGSPITALADIGALPLGTAAAPVTIASVATVSIEDDPASSITRTNGVPTLALSVTKKPDGDTVGISHAVADLIPRLEAELGSGAKITTVFDQGPFIERSIRDLTTEGLLGLGFAVVVILCFLLSVRATLVTAISIPLSLLVTFIGLHASGNSLNILTLGALTIAIGRVVDDSIVVIENIKRHLGYGEDKHHAVVTGVREVASAITASTLTTVAVFAPIALVSGLVGQLFRPFALTVTMALLASLLVALTIVPVLAYWFLADPVAGAASGTPPAADAAPAAAASGTADARAGEGQAAAVRRATAVRRAAEARERRSRLQRGYLPVLNLTQRHPVITLLSGVVLPAATAAMTPLLQTNLLGNTGQNTFAVTQTLAPGSSLATTAQAAQKTENVLKTFEAVRDVQLIIGSTGDTRPGQASAGASVASFTVITDEAADQDALRLQVRQALAGITDAGSIAVSAQDTGFGAASTVDVIVSAPDSARLQQASDAVVQALNGTPGAGQVSSNLVPEQPLIQVTVDRAGAVAAGLSEQQISALVAGTLSPVTAGTLRLGVTDFPVLIGRGTRLTSLAQLQELTIPTPAGPVPLTAVASAAQVKVPTTITSSNGERTARISITPSGADLGALSGQVQRRLDGLNLPEGAATELGGAATQQTESFGQLYLALLGAVAIVYVIMVAAFKSLLQPLILLVSVPFAATGAIALLLITRVPLGLPSLIGLLMLVGIVVTNAIVLIDLINQYRRPHDGRPGLDVAEAIRQGARKRLRPILMTAVATIFALTPMALGLTAQGGFISRPLAIVVIGGLVSSTALTLVLVPVLYRLLEGGREARRIRAGRSGRVPGAGAAQGAGMRMPGVTPKWD